MACSGLGILFDTCVFVPCLVQEPGYPGVLLEIVREDGFYAVLCDALVDEYVRVANREHGGSGSFLKQRLDSFMKEGILVWVTPAERNLVEIKSAKDQPIVDCAVGGESKAHFIVTNDIEDFEILSSASRIVPKIVSLEDFLDSQIRENQCRDCKQGR